MKKNNYMISLDNCSKSYGNECIFKGISYSFKNDIYWITGRNGVGKSVLTRCMLGAEKFTEGNEQNYAKKILYLPDLPIAESWLSVDENILLFAYYFGIDITNEKLLQIKNSLQLNYTDKVIDKLSMGTKMKVGCSLLFVENFWDVIVLDETLVHLDLESKKTIFNEIKIRANEGSTVVIMEHVEDDNHLYNDLVKLVLKEDGIYEENR